MYGLDVDALTVELQRLTTLLERPLSGVSRWVDASERDRLTRSLGELVSSFGSIDLATKRALLGSVSSARDGRSNSLAASLRELCDGVGRHFHSQIDESDRAQLRSMLSFPAPDYLDALNAADSENAHSDVLAHLLSPRRSPGFGPAALGRLARFLPRPDHWAALIAEGLRRDEISVRREVRTGAFWEQGRSLDRLDIVISAKKFVIVIENKLWSQEHNEQTDGYWEWLTTLPGEKAAILLSPPGFKAQSRNFVALSYLQLASCFLGEVPDRHPEEEVMLSGYFRTVFGNILRPHFHAIMGGHE